MTTRCCGASWRSFPSGASAASTASTWSADEEAVWRTACDLLVESALAQPRVAVHRDFMPRNLMVATPNPGILDFQDAVHGPISYDVASLLRDAFISWDEEQELDWAVRYWEAARKAALPVPDDFGDFWRTVEWMGLQRHLKVLGIFCRLKHRDGKPAYSADLAALLRLRPQGLGALQRAAAAVAAARAADGRQPHRSVLLGRDLARCAAPELRRAGRQRCSAVLFRLRRCCASPT